MSFTLPAVDTVADLAPAFSAVLAAMSGGVLAPDEAVTVAGILEMKRKAIETVEIERRIAALEAGTKK